MWFSDHAVDAILPRMRTVRPAWMIKLAAKRPTGPAPTIRKSICVVDSEGGDDDMGYCRKVGKRKVRLFFFCSVSMQLYISRRMSKILQTVKKVG